MTLVYECIGCGRCNCYNEHYDCDGLEYCTNCRFDQGIS